MPKIVITAASFGVISLVALTNAEARFGAGMIVEASDGRSTAQSAQYYGGYGYYRRGMATRGDCAPRYDGYKDSRDALNTCSYC